MSEDNEKSMIDTVVSINNTKQTANKDLGITHEYNKANRDKLWDSAKDKAEYKDKMFGDSQIYIDPVSGKALHKRQKSAQNKYHMKNKDGENVSSKWAEHSAETDHINALKDVHDKAKHNPFLSDSDFKEIMNSDENYRLLSKAENASKGDKSDFELILDKNSGISAEGKVKLAKDKVNADINLHTRFAARTAKNVGTEFSVGAKDALVASAIPLVSEGVRRMVNVAQGKESFEDAAKNMGKITLNVAVAGGSNKLLVDVISSQFANSGNVLLQNIAGSNQVAQIIAVVAIVQDSAVKYINGEIDEKEFINQIGEKGTMMVAGMIGGEIGREIGGIIGAVVGTAAMPLGGTAAGYVTGRVIGEILGIVITTVACSAIVSIYNTSKHLNDYKLKESQIARLERDALNEMANQRAKFREIVEREYKIWDETIQSGFDQMLSNACKDTFNLQGLTDGLDKVLSVFGKSVKFKDLEEYESQLGLTLKLEF